MGLRLPAWEGGPGRRAEKGKGMSHILEVNGLTTVFDGDAGQVVSVDHASFFVDSGETVCIVGESGCGKSVTSLSIMGLLGRGGRVKEGQALFEGRDLLAMPEKELDRLRGNEISMIFQDPLTSLNPVFTIGRQISESIRIHMDLHKEAAMERAEGLLEKVGMPDPKAAMKKYPHMLSGGQRQRVMIAMALACGPKLLIADEPTTALDVTIQAQIMELLRQLQRELNMAVILITHDIGLVAQMADRVLVMYAGQMIEQAPVLELFDRPAHPYTRALLRSVPSIPRKGGPALVGRLASIEGSVPERYGQMAGCRFAERCPYREGACGSPQTEMELGPGHKARCFKAGRFSEFQGSETPKEV